MTEVVLTKGGNPANRFGFANVLTEDRRSLQISWIDESGLLAQWNLQYPGAEIKEGAIIMSVNGIVEDQEAMRSQLQSDTIRMQVHRGHGGTLV